MVKEQPIFNYDEESDTLYISFQPGKKATGIELNDNILLRIDKQERKVVGLTFLNYSILAQLTEVGPRSFPLTGLTVLPQSVRSVVLNILRSAPVNQILWISTYTPSFTNTMPIASLLPALKAA
jgi:uncharacterized protein YuzE